MKRIIVAIVAIIFMLSWGMEAHAAAVPRFSLGDLLQQAQPQQHKYYSVDGATLSLDLQDYIYETLKDYDMEWYFPTFLCQVYQESHFNQSAMAYHANGTVDVGLCQLKSIYHDEIRSIAGLGPEANFYTDPYANLAGGMALMRRNWTACWDINTAISAYFTGSTSQYSSTYVADVRKWENTLMEVKSE